MIETELRSLYRELVEAAALATAEEVVAMERSAERMRTTVSAGADVYGVTRGFGPLVRFEADADSIAQGLGLIHHLSAGHGAPLSRSTTQLMLRLRLSGMTRGYSAVSVSQWQRLADLHNAGFVPVVPSIGSVSASGDLIPLAHAALALAGRGEAWTEGPDGWIAAPAAEVLDRLGVEPITWDARDALAFVNGSSASLAVTLENHVRIEDACWAAAALTGRAVELLGASAEPYAETVVNARGGLDGHRLVSRWIRKQIGVERTGAEARMLQEAYSLRCAPQIIGSVWDHLQALGHPLLREATACSDNPVVAPEGIFHAGNFHAIGAGLTSDHHASLVHQLAFLAERQLAGLVEPATNGGFPALLAASPGATSGLAGAQLAASAMVASIRQQAMPATTTAVPTNLSNQDIVPMALVGALRTTRQLDLLDLVLGTLAVAVGQIGHLSGSDLPDGMWSRIGECSPRLETDRPLSAEVRECAEILLDGSRQELGTIRSGASVVAVAPIL